jgi:DDE superfamily endonuclease
VEKKSHTAKSLLLTNKTRRIAYLSSIYPGSLHDYTILQQCFPSEHQWFHSLAVRLDLGFQGFAELYRCGRVFLPIKKKRVAKGKSNELTDEQKQHNKLQAQERIIVEHSIGGMKRYRILSNRLRVKSTTLMDTIIGVCAGLWNFSLN